MKRISEEETRIKPQHGSEVTSVKSIQTIRRRNVHLPDSHCASARISAPDSDRFAGLFFTRLILVRTFALEDQPGVTATHRRSES